MLDTRVEKLAAILVNYSICVKPGENVLVQATGYEPAFDRALVKAIHQAGGNAFVSLRDKTIDRELLLNASAGQIELQAELELARMKKMQCFIGYSAIRNMSAMNDVPGDKMDLYNRNIWKKVHIEQRLPHTRWVVLRYPTAAMAQMAGLSEEAFEEFYFQVCTMDYAKMSLAMDKLVALMAKTDQVRLVAAGTDLCFSIKGLPPIKCDGKLNIPDGEVYSAPVKDSVNGHISYNTPSEHEGFTYEQIRFEFKDGKIIKASANDSVRLNRVLDTDEGARYVGEFAIGVNPFITKAMKETLFDEKIAGSIHFTPGNSYDDCFNGNRSAVHWDLVLIQTPEFGGGEIWFDGVLVRKDGLFVVPELLCLNPDQLR
ncbi:MAG: aminopeptidase [Spirochaetes bacterium GWD1_61_31]|nr:MAG: aminopeptidase [Spirochaetes bacterium GWB1_60_80]OHD33110.1 MAG: aminopeptidase [Spirochaetes bacterium GWC1_61_12]OHD39575.1 MAG: aminopeptidase [Spirochaetes bacterium GWD1_61_31]OHD43849.1 MAG: aminopeptidase [Spirochaetes bacterium GWE1_60_18]OHD61163.1 MAG: aminopeptidase [Spirochaetes bacterium GWF1_60_12]HAP44279.1 aminopeptidase [Spirochaetaceae bacterium]